MKLNHLRLIMLRLFSGCCEMNQFQKKMLSSHESIKPLNVFISDIELIDNISLLFSISDVEHRSTILVVFI